MIELDESIRPRTPGAWWARFRGETIEWPCVVHDDPDLGLHWTDGHDVYPVTSPRVEWLVAIPTASALMAAIGRRAA